VVSPYESFRVGPRSRKVLSSQLTLVYKVFVPVFCSGVPAVLSAVSFFGIFRGGYDAFISILVATCGALTWAAMRSFVVSVREAVDEVVDEGDSLIIRKRGVKDRVPLSRIVAVLDGPIQRFQTVMLRLDPPCAFGREIMFFPQYRFSWHWITPIVSELRERIVLDAQRTSPRIETQAEPSDAAASP